MSLHALPPGVDLLSQALQANNSLTSLNLNGNSLGIDAGVSLANIIHKRCECPLEVLDVSKNGIADAGMQDFTKPLGTNNRLRELNLRHNLICDVGIALLVDALGFNSTLQKLNLASNSFQDPGPLGKLLQPEGPGEGNECKLASLDLSSNAIGGGDGFCAFAEKLLVNTTLSELMLTACRLGDEDTAMLAECMVYHPKLRTLHLASNSLSPLAAEVLAESFAKARVKLTELNLSSNPLCSDGAGALVAGLKGNSTLVSLNLYDTGIGDEGAAAIVAALRDEDTASVMTTLDLSRNAVARKLMSVVRIQLEERKEGFY